jgi:ubiquinone/menaquinone biosynthesis C-methylase UbiE
VVAQKLDNRSYYDDFAGWYERERGQGYHRMLDDLEVGLVARYGQGADILEVGCGTGLLLGRFADFANRAVGVDISHGMLGHAHARDLRVCQGSATALPFASASFDVVCSFKVLAHITDIHTAMAEMARITRPGGHVIAEFYNPRSLRYLIKSIKPPTAVSATTSDEAVYTRYDTTSTIAGYLPAELEWVTTRGVRIITPFAQLHRIPAIGSLLRHAEHRLADLPLARNLGGFIVVVARKN